MLPIKRQNRTRANGNLGNVIEEYDDVTSLFKATHKFVVLGSHD